MVLKWLRTVPSGYFRNDYEPYLLDAFEIITNRAQWMLWTDYEPYPVDAFEMITNRAQWMPLKWLRTVPSGCFWNDYEPCLVEAFEMITNRA